MKNMILAVIFPRFFNGKNIIGFLDDADGFVGTGCIAAVMAGIQI
jgi:hypothetical protein